MECIKNSKIIREKNRMTILKSFGTDKEISRTTLTEITGLTKGTVTTIVKELIQEGIIFESESGESSGGRKPVFLKLNPHLGFFMVIDLGISFFNFKVFDLFQNCILEHSIKLKNFEIKSNLDNLISVIEKLVSELPKSKFGLLGISIAVRGEVDLDGLIRFIPKFGWKNVNLKKILEDKFKTEIYVDKHSNFSAIMEQKACGDTKEMVFISIDEVFSTGVITKGSLARGYMNLASSLGHHVIKFDGIKCECGRIGCLEQYCSEMALLRDINKKIKVESMEKFYHLIEQKNKICLEVLDSFIKVLTVGINNIIFIINPEIIIIQCELLKRYNYLLEEINKNLILPITGSQKIKLSKFDKNQFFKGACNIMIESFYEKIIKF